MKKVRLQKVTKAVQILQMGKFGKKEFAYLKQLNKIELGNLIAAQCKKLPNEKRLDFLNCLWPVLDCETRRQTYEYNHLRIKQEIHNGIINDKSVPAINEISARTHLSRKTIYKHLKSIDTSKYYLEERLKEKMISMSLKDKVLSMAMQGDIKAARLYFQLTGTIKQTGTETSWLTINNTAIDLKILALLPVESKEKIERVIEAELIKVKG